MQKNFLRETVSIVVGKSFETIADLLDSKKHVNEFLIAKKMDMTINQVRNLLYKLSDQGLVTSIRKKDKRKGWYTYLWKLEKIKCLEFLKTYFSKQIDQLGSQIKNRETKQFYICERCKIEFSEENALLYDFICNECGDVFALKDNTKLVKEFRRSLNALQKNLGFVEVELEKELENAEKIKERARKKVIKEVAAKRKTKKSAKKSTKKKISKKITKSSVKKKAVKKKPAKKKTKKKIVKKKKK